MICPCGPGLKIANCLLQQHTHAYAEAWRPLLTDTHTLKVLGVATQATWRAMTLQLAIAKRKAVIPSADEAHKQVKMWADVRTDEERRKRGRRKRSGWLQQPQARGSGGGWALERGRTYEAVWKQHGNQHTLNAFVFSASVCVLNKVTRTNRQCLFGVYVCVGRPCCYRLMAGLQKTPDMEPRRRGKKKNAPMQLASSSFEWQSERMNGAHVPQPPAGRVAATGASGKMTGTQSSTFVFVRCWESATWWNCSQLLTHFTAAMITRCNLFRHFPLNIHPWYWKDKVLCRDWTDAPHTNINFQQPEFCYAAMQVIV